MVLDRAQGSPKRVQRRLQTNRFRQGVPVNECTGIEGELVAVYTAAYGDERAGSRTAGATGRFLEVVDRDRDQLVKRLEENGQSRVPPPITQAFPVEVSDEFGDRRGATIVTLDEPSRTTLDFSN